MQTFQTGAPPRRRNGSIVEPMERRLLLSANSWKSPVSGDWDDPTKWSLGHVPTASEDATISVAGTYSVTHSMNLSDQVHSLTSARPFTLSAGQLTVGSSIQVNNAFTLDGGTIVGGTIKPGTGGQGVTVDSGNSELSGVMLAANLSMLAPSALTLDGTTNLQNSTITLTDNNPSAYNSLGFNSQFTPMTLGGTGNIVFAGTQASNNRLFSGNGPGPSTIGAGITVHGMGGTFLYNYGSPAWINAGKVQSDVAGQTITINGPITNNGTMTAINGAGLTIASPWTNNPGHTMSAVGGSTLTLAGGSLNKGTISETNSTLNLEKGSPLSQPITQSGSIVRSGGTVNLDGALDMHGTPLTFNAATGNWILNGGGIANSTLTFAGGFGLTLTSTGGELIHDTLASSITIGNGLSLSVANGLTLNAGVSITIASTGSATTLGFDQNNFGSQLIGGAGQIIFAGTSAGNDKLFSGNGSGVVTFGSGITIRGSGGYLWENYLSPAYINQGTFLADTPGGKIELAYPSDFVNQGNLIAAPGTFQFDGGFDTTKGTLTVGIGGTSPGVSYGQFTASQAVTLGGTLDTVLMPGFTPKAGQKFTAFTYQSKSGNFVTVNKNAGNGFMFTPAVGATGVVLAAAGGGATFASLSGSILSVNGTSGNDTMTLASARGIVTATLNGTKSVFLASRVATASINTGAGVNTADASAVAFNVILTGGSGNDKLVGGSGNDILLGGGGNDLLIGNAGNNILNGGAGNNTYQGGNGNDIYQFANPVGVEADVVSEGAGQGTDLLDFSAVTLNVVGNLGSNTLATMTGRTVKTQVAGQFINFENFTGGSGNDTITGNAAVNVLSGGPGNDKFFALDGKKDSLDGGTGTDSIGSADAIDVKISIP